MRAAENSRDRLFDAGWQFLREDAPGAENPSFDDSKWRRLDLTRDWGIEDLAPKSGAVPELEAVTGEWRFQPGDNAAWNARDFNDWQWPKVALPDNWEHHSNYTKGNVYGWFRRRIAIPADCRDKDFDLLMGRIDDVDEVWFNGERLAGPADLLYTPGAVMLGLVHNYLPFMVLPIYASVEKLDRSLVEAAYDLGAGPWRAFRGVTLPLTLPGVIGGALLVFVPAVAMFAIVTLMGGGSTELIGNTIQKQFTSGRNQPLGAALECVQKAGL